MTQVIQKNATVANPDSHMAKYLAEAESLCRIVASIDLAGHPIYIVAQSQLAKFFGLADGCYAYTTPSLDLYLQQYIDNWRGRGPCMVINDLATDVRLAKTLMADNKSPELDDICETLKISRSTLYRYANL